MSERRIIRRTQAEKDAKQVIKDLKGQKKLNARQNRALSDARGVNRRVLLRWGVFGGGTLLVPGAATKLLYDLAQPGENDRPSWISVEGEDVIGKERVKEAVKAAKEWADKYGVERNIKISPLPQVASKQLPGNRTEIVEERAGPGYIKIGQISDARLIILHAMTHAAQPEKPELFAQPVAFSQGHFRGIQGLSFLVTDSNGVSKNAEGEDAKFTLFEEAMAERNASAFSGYSVDNPSYFAIGKLARQHVPFDKYPQAHEWAKTNNLPAFIRAALKLDVDAKISVEQIEQVMQQYQAVSNNAS